MLKRKKKVIAKVMATTMLATTIATTFGIEANADSLTPRTAVSSSKIAGNDRYKTAVEISKNYSSSSKHAVIVNGQKGIVDALTATPYASLKNAPILMTQSDKLNADTKAELTRRGIKTVDIVGGLNSVNDSVKSEIQAMGITVNRIAGNSKYDTALEVAKKIDDISDISKIAVANGEVLADAVSVAAPAAQNKMPIILAHPKNGLDDKTKAYINGEGVNTSYVIGGTNSVSSTTQNSLPGSKKRLEGDGRQDTNAAVIKEFYTSSSYDNVYVTKSGQVNKQDEIADALAVGVLAAKEQDPVVIVGKTLADSQSKILADKSFNKVTEIGNGIPSSSIEGIKNTQSTVKDATTVMGLKSTLSSAKDGDTINFKPNSTVSEEFTISTDKNVTVNLEGTYTKAIRVDMENGALNINGNVSEKVSVDDIKTLKVRNGVTVKHLEIKSGAKNSSIVNSGTVTTFDVLATGVSISGSGNITTLNPQGDTDYSGVTGKIENFDMTKPVSQIVSQNAKELVIRFSKQIDESSIIESSNDTLVDGKIILTKDKAQNIDAYKASLDSSRMTLTITAPKGEKFDGTYRIDVKNINSNGIKLDDYSTTFKAEDKVSPTVSEMTFNQQNDTFDIVLSEPIDNLQGLVLRVDGISVEPKEKPSVGTAIDTTKTLTISRSTAGISLNSNATIYIAGLKDANSNTMVSKSQNVSTKNDALKISSVSTISDDKIKIQFSKKLNNASHLKISAMNDISVFKNSDSAKTQQINSIERDATDSSDRTYIINLKSSILGDKDTERVTLTINDKAYADETGTQLPKYENTSITLNKDKVAPTVKTSSITNDKKFVEVVFSENVLLDVNAKDKFRLVRSGVIETDKYKVEVKPESNDTIRFTKKDGQKLDSGTYKINLNEGIVSDVSVSKNVNKGINLSEFTVVSDVEDPLELGVVENYNNLPNHFKIVAPAGEKFTLDSLNYENFKLDGNIIDKNSFIHYDGADESSIVVNLPESDSVDVSPDAELTVLGLKLQSSKAIKEDSNKIQKKVTVKVQDNKAPDLASSSIKIDSAKRKAEIKLTFNERMQVENATGGTGAGATISKDNIQSLKDELIIKTGYGTSEVFYDFNANDEAKIEVSGKDIIITVMAVEGSKLLDVIKSGNSVVIEIKKLDDGGNRDIKDINGVDARVGKSSTIRSTGAIL